MPVRESSSRRPRYAKRVARAFSVEFSSSDSVCYPLSGNRALTGDKTLVLWAEIANIPRIKCKVIFPKLGADRYRSFIDTHNVVHFAGTVEAVIARLGACRQSPFLFAGRAQREIVNSCYEMCASTQLSSAICERYLSADAFCTRRII